MKSSICPLPLPSLLLFLFGLLLLSPAVSFAQDELLIPLPGTIPKGEDPVKKPSEVLIPLPGSIPKNEKPAKPEKAGIIPLPAAPKTENTTLIITPSEGATGEIVIEPSAPPPMPTVPPPPDPGAPKPGPVASGTSGPIKNPLPAYPKDTSSAMFMLMKTWECDAYDGHVLLEHSVKTYGEDSGDPFIIKGIEGLPAFQVSLREDDITLDELLDILANKHQFDWGVDIPGKVVYVYPGR